MVEVGHGHPHFPSAGVQEVGLLCVRAGQAGGIAHHLASHLFLGLVLVPLEEHSILYRGRIGWLCVLEVAEGRMAADPVAVPLASVPVVDSW